MGHTKPQTNRCRKYKAILGPADCMQSTWPAGKKTLAELADGSQCEDINAHT